MTLQSSEPRQLPPAPHTPDDGPHLECQLSPNDPASQTLRIRARRFYPVSRQELFAAWTRRTAWDSWMRLRARSRSTVAPYRGGTFRLELAEGPTIHVITGTVIDVRLAESLSLSWVHHGKSDYASTVDASFRERHRVAELSLVHGHIASRREAAWLMRLWATALDRLASYFEEGSSTRARRSIDRPTPIIHTAEPEVRRPSQRTAFARSA